MAAAIMLLVMRMRLGISSFIVGVLLACLVRYFLANNLVNFVGQFQQLVFQGKAYG